MDEEASLNVPARPRRRWLRRVLLAASLLLVAAVGVTVYLVRTPPAHWRQYQRFKANHTTAQIEALAARVEASLYDMLEADLPAGLRTPRGTESTTGDMSAGLGGEKGGGGEAIDPSMIRVNEVRTLTLTRDELTALIATHHEQWLESRGYIKPRELSDLMVHLENGELVTSFQYDTLNLSQVFSTRFSLRFEDDGMATIRLSSFSAGRMPVPAGRIAQHLRNQADYSDRAAEWLAKLDNFRFKPVIDNLPHRRRVTVLDYRIEGQTIQLTVRVQDFRTYQGV